MSRLLERNLKSPGALIHFLICSLIVCHSGSVLCCSAYMWLEQDDADSYFVKHVRMVGFRAERMDDENSTKSKTLLFLINSEQRLEREKKERKHSLKREKRKSSLSNTLSINE